MYAELVSGPFEYKKDQINGPIIDIEIDQISETLVHKNQPNIGGLFVDKNETNKWTFVDKN